MQQGFGRLLISIAAGSLLAACGDDETTDVDSGMDAGVDGAIDAGVDAGPDEDAAMDAGGDGGDGGDALVARGEYLVMHLADCVSCHTPLGENGLPQEDKLMAGNPAFADLAPADDEFGLLTTPNLTPAGPLGHEDYTDEVLRQVITEGHHPEFHDPDGGTADGGTPDGGSADGGPSDGGAPEEHVLISVMPYWYYANLRDEDLDAIVAFLRSLEPVENDIPESQPPWTAPPWRPAAPLTPIDPASVPETTLSPDAGTDFERAQRGRYLASAAGPCMECHTVWDMEQLGSGQQPLEMSQAFAGGRAFPTPPFPRPPDAGLPNPIFSVNVTPHPDGIEGWTVMQVQAALQEGEDDEGQRLCPPMPAGPMGAFGGITDEDAIALGTYLTTLAPKPIPEGTYSPNPPPDGGVDGGADGGTSTVYNYECALPPM